MAKGQDVANFDIDNFMPELPDPENQASSYSPPRDCSQTFCVYLNSRVIHKHLNGSGRVKLTMG